MKDFYFYTSLKVHAYILSRPEKGSKAKKRRKK